VCSKEGPVGDQLVDRLGSRVKLLHQFIGIPQLVQKM
jgi:hypothetical protein